jgi:hypothetical protein
MKFNLSDPTFILVLIGLLLIVGCAFAYGYGFNLTEGFQDQITEPTSAPEEEIIIESPPENEPVEPNVEPNVLPNLLPNVEPNVLPNEPTVSPNVESEVQVPALHTPTPTSINLIKNTVIPMGANETTESRPMNDRDYENAPDDNAKSNTSNEKAPWVRHKGIHHGRDLNLTPRIPNISQIGGEGPSNYFHPNIVISRGNDDSKQTHRFELGLGPEIMNIVNGFTNNMQMTGNTQSNNTQPDNTGFNFADMYNTNSTTTSSVDTGNLVNNAMNFVNGLSGGGLGGGLSLGGNANMQNDLWDENEMQNNNYDPENDFFNTAKINMQRSQNQELKQKGESKLCHKDPNTSHNPTDNSINYNQELFQNSFEHNPSMKKFMPGYQYQNPSGWNVPQKRPPVCLGCKDKCLPSGVFDRGTPMQALELTNNTQVGSIMPKFKYIEEPRS